MTGFRKELLELLYKNSGDWVDINPLLEKYCGTETSFNSGDDTLIKCRNNINVDLRELKNDMKWIYLNPDGYNTGHQLNHETGKRQFLFNDFVKAKMTMKGELEYKATKDKSTSVMNNIQNIGANNGIAAQESDLKNLQAAFQPIITPLTVQKTAVNKHGIMTSIGKWILNHIVATIITGLLLAYIIFKLGWN